MTKPIKSRDNYRVTNLSIRSILLLSGILALAFTIIYDDETPKWDDSFLVVYVAV